MRMELQDSLFLFILTGSVVFTTVLISNPVLIFGILGLLFLFSEEPQRLGDTSFPEDREVFGVLRLLQTFSLQFHKWATQSFSCYGEVFRSIIQH